jgi:carboxymethylenebutenolidase
VLLASWNRVSGPRNQSGYCFGGWTGWVRSEVYWGHADQDPSMTAENIATLDRAMDDAGLRHTTELYQGAQHGYTMSDGGTYNEAAAERHFTALFALLQRAIPR